jgi:hypothetical protein
LLPYILADSRVAQSWSILHIVDARSIAFRNAGSLIRDVDLLRIAVMAPGGVPQGSDSFQLIRFAWNTGGWE